MATIARPRYSVDGGYSRGEETRARIIDAAIALFGERGFDGASTRDIAARAGVNAPALQYYFDNKEGVYLACAEHTVSRVWDYLSDVVTRAERALADNAGDETLIDAFCGIQAQIAELMFTRPAAEGWRLMMAREQAGLGPARGFQILYERVSKRIYATTTAIIGRLLGRPAEDEETRIRAMALSGQLMFFSTMRRTALTVLNWDAIDGDRPALVKRLIVEQTRGLLRSMVTADAASHRAQPLIQQQPSS
jgi:TetR/AcrR family transcriptional regulator, regulator of cefoperazone and chloramphenicol sensitivity